MKKTAVAAALTALAVPAAAQADRPDKPGEQGKAKAQQKRGDKQQRSHGQRSHKQRKNRGVGVAFAGTKLDSTVTDGKLTAFTLDLTRANRHARKVLGVDRAFVRGDALKTITVAAGDTFKVRFNGVTDGSDEGTTVDFADVLPTDRVKVIGKAKRTRTRSGETRTVQYGDLDIKKIVIKRATETETERDDD